MCREDFRGMVILLEKIVRDGRQIAKGGSQLSAKQLKQRVGVKPSLSDCLGGLTILHEMHNSEYGHLFFFPNALNDSETPS